MNLFSTVMMYGSIIFMIIGFIGWYCNYQWHEKVLSKLRYSFPVLAMGNGILFFAQTYAVASNTPRHDDLVLYFNIGVVILLLIDIVNATRVNDEA